MSVRTSITCNFVVIIITIQRKLISTTYTVFELHPKHDKMFEVRYLDNYDNVGHRKYLIFLAWPSLVVSRPPMTFYSDIKRVPNGILSVIRPTASRSIRYLGHVHTWDEPFKNVFSNNGHYRYFGLSNISQ